MRLITDFDLQLLFGTALRPYSPTDLKLLNRGRLCDVLTAAMSPYTILQFSLPADGYDAYGVKAPERGARDKFASIRSGEYERALHGAVMSILAVADVRQR